MGQRRAVFISGAGSGIGRAIAHHFAGKGWFVGLGDRDRRAMDETVAGMAGGYSYSHVFDVSDRAAWDAALRVVARAAGGRIDCVVNNAGLPLAGPIAEYATDEIDEVVAVNFLGAVYGAQAAYPYLKAAPAGACLVNTASAAALHGIACQSVYGATKAAVRSLTESLDAEWADDGIRVRSLMPGFVETPLLDCPPNRARGGAIRRAVIDARLDILPAAAVARACYACLTSRKTHHVVGRTARSLRFMAALMPGALRRRGRRIAAAYRGQAID